MARLEDSHFLDPAGQHAPSPFPLDWHVKGQDEFRDVGDVRPRAGGIRRPSPELDRGFQKAPGLPARFFRINDRQSSHRGISMSAVGGDDVSRGGWPSLDTYTQQEKDLIIFGS